MLVLDYSSWLMQIVAPPVSTPDTDSYVGFPCCVSAAALSNVQLGQRAAFSWEFSGLGNATCVINGVNPSNTTGMCTSPLVYPIVTTLNQTLMVNYTDVCAVTHSIGMTFGTFGWELQGSTVVSALGGSNTLALSDRGELAARRSSMNAAGAVSAAAWMHVTAAAAAVVFAALLL